MDIELKKKLIRMLEKMNNAPIDAKISDFSSEIFDLEMELKKSRRSIMHYKTPELKEAFVSLTPEQTQHYETVSWLTNPAGPRGVGRSHLMAIAFIEHALYTGHTIRLFNHSNTPFCLREMINRISGIMSNVKGLSLTVNKGLTTIKVKRVYLEEVVKYNKGDRSWPGDTAE